ncbi:hypothetical protein G6F43_012307 [Rhizopus delemar]|nr:hypothetical protein G6F43_012307 [Rhizopus delemar]
MDPFCYLGFPLGKKRYALFLEEAEEWCIDSTHKTCKSLNNPAENSYLFTIVVRSPITNKGVPVCFFITDREVLSTLEQWLTWLKSTFTLKIKKIMIDCSPTEIGAIRSVFGDVVQVLLCHWHIKRAWETHIKKDIKVDKATKQSENVRSAVRASLNSMMYAKSCEEFDLAVSLFNVKYKEYTSFVDYFNKLWVPKKQNWSQAWSQLAAFEEKKRAKAYEINFDIACSMIEKIDEDSFSCDSFTSDGKYIVKIVDNCISACSCPDTAKICKHIFLTSRITQIPFSLCFSLVEPLSDDLPDVEDSCDIDEAENLRLAEYLENIQKYHNSFNSIYQQKMSKIKSGMRMHTLSKMEDAMKRSIANISDVDENSASLPPRQR